MLNKLIRGILKLILLNSNISTLMYVKNNKHVGKTRDVEKCGLLIV